MAIVSLCMIVKDEEEVLGRCLDCFGKAADEIILVDTGSRDRTKEIAKAYTDKIYDFAWQDDFSAARNYGLEKAFKEQTYRYYGYKIDEESMAVLTREPEELNELLAATSTWEKVQV